MPTGGFVGYAPANRSSGSAGANSIFLTPLVVPQNAIATAVLLDVPNAASGISTKAVIYDGAHSALLATGSTVTSVVIMYNRLPLTANLNLTAGTTYYVGYVDSTGINVAIDGSGGPGAWFASGGQSVASPANPLSVGSTNAATLMIALEFDGTGMQAFGWGPDFTSGVTLATLNTVATMSASANRGVRGIATRVAVSGKYYAEVDIGGTVATDVAVGIGSVNCPVTVMTTTAVSYRAVLAASGTRSGATGIGLTYASGDTVGIAYDGNNVWWNKNNGSWFGSSSTAGNPATSSGGYFLNSATVQWPMALLAGTVTGTAATFRLRDTADQLRYTPPAGFSAWSTGSLPAATSQARAMVLA